MGMELWYTPTSPFARKVRVSAHEMGLQSRLLLVETDPWTDPKLRALNPLAKVPTLVLDDGEVVWESGLIVERLQALVASHDIIPMDAVSRWRALTLQALADGASTSAGRLFADERRPAPERSSAMLQRFAETIQATLDYLERTVLSASPTIGEISVAVLLGYLDFRWPDRDWRQPRPGLAQWFASFAARRSMIETAHRAPRVGSTPAEETGPISVR
jgi:glutathione S-transferase